MKVNLDKLAERLEQGRLQPGAVVTMQTLREAGVIGKKIASGVKLLGGVGTLVAHTLLVADQLHTEMHQLLSSFSWSVAMLHIMHIF